MASMHPERPPSGSRRWVALRQRAPLLLVTGGLVGMLLVAAAVGWVDWVVGHPGQAWAWVRKRWFGASALGVFVAVASLVVAVVMPRWQQSRTVQLAAAQEARQQQLEQERLARQREQAAAVKQAAWERRCRELLSRWPLPTLEEVNPYEIGVFYSRRADAFRGQRPRLPYVPRAVDRELARLLRSQPLVLIKGQSRAGKSRTAFEIAARELAGWRLLLPKDRTALAGLGELERLPGEGERVLVWLDDLDQYLAVQDTRGLNAGLLARLTACNPPMKVLATIRLEEHALLAATPGELGRSIRELLNRFDPGAMTLPVGFDNPAERVAIAELYPGEEVIGGLAEHLGAAHELADRLEHGEASVPEGAGLVLAAVDRRRAGLNRPVSREELAALLPLYLKRLRPLAPMVRAGDVDRGLGWASEPVGRTAALLVADPDPLAGTFWVADPIVDFVERRTKRRLVDPAVWDHLLGQVSPEEAGYVGFAAFRRKEWAAAKAAYQQAIAFGGPEDVPFLTAALGLVLTEQGHVAGARAAYQQAIDYGNPELAPLITHRLGTLLANSGDVDGAQAALQQAINSGHPHATAKSLHDLGILLARQGDVAGARTAYQQAIDSGHPDAAPEAVVSLGLLLAQQGDVAGAHELW
jgi:tetratricopeptide (TPR) repeat protein